LQYDKQDRSKRGSSGGHWGVREKPRGNRVHVKEKRRAVPFFGTDGEGIVPKMGGGGVVGDEREEKLKEIQ